MERFLRVVREGGNLDDGLLFEMHLNDGQSIYLTDVGDDVYATVGTVPPTPTGFEEFAEAEVEEPTLVQDFDEMTVEELKGILRDRDMPVSGNKAELVERLNEG